MKEQTVFKKELTEDELAAKIEELDKKIKDREADRYYADSFEQASQISDDISDLFTERNALKATLDKMLSAEDKGKETMSEKLKDNMDKCTIDISYDKSNLIVISKEPDADNKYLFFEYMPIDAFEEPIVEKQLISPEMRDKFMALYEQYENGDNTEICAFVGSGLWSDNSETLYQCDGYKDICIALSSDPQFLSFMKDYVCQEYNFKSALEEYINEKLAAHNDVGYALSAAEQLGYTDLVDSTRQMLKEKTAKERPEKIERD